MAKVRPTKHELKKQSDDLKRFLRYLPTLELKAKQLQQALHGVRNAIRGLRAEIEVAEASVSEWAGVFAEGVDLQVLFRVREVLTEAENIAGVEITVFRRVVFEDMPYDLFATPLWVDRGIAACKAQISRLESLRLAERQQQRLQEELRITTQRINLFEKVKIPQARRNIRSIRIFLGDQQRMAVVRGKIAKANLEKQQQGADRI